MSRNRGNAPLSVAGNSIPWYRLPAAIEIAVYASHSRSLDLLESVRSWFEHATISSPCSIVSTSELLSGAVRRVRGVRAIATEIEVRYPSDKKTADDEIARRALDILAWDATVPRNAVKITVHDGRVTLSGDVNWQFEWRAAEDQVRKLTGVNAIINNIAYAQVSSTIGPSEKPPNERHGLPPE